MANFLQRVFRSVSNTVNPQPWLVSLFGGSATNAGQNVNSQNAPQLITVFACVNLIADIVASLPRSVYKCTGKHKKEYPAHPLYNMWAHNPSYKYNGYFFIKTIVTNLLLRGNAYVLPIKENGKVRLEILDPDHVQINDFYNQEISYTVFLKDKKTLELRPDQIIHLKYWTVDGIHGISPIAYAKETIGVGLASITHLGRFYQKGTVPPGVLKIMGNVRDADRLKQIGGQFDSAVRDGRTPVLPEGSEYNSITVSLRDAQFIETMKFTNEELCRLFKVPPHKVGIMEHGNYNNSIEAQNHQFISDCIRPLIEMIETEFEYKLLDDTKFNFEIDMSYLMRGDIQTMVQRNVSYWNIGVFSANEIRESEGFDPIPDGDTYQKPMHMSHNGDINNGKINNPDAGKTQKT